MIADIGMPGQDGLSMMRAIRRAAAAAGGEVPSIALSAFARAEDRRAALAAGFDDYLTKPALPADVLGALAGLSSPTAPAAAHAAVAPSGVGALAAPGGAIGGGAWQRHAAPGQVLPEIADRGERRPSSAA